MFGPPAHSAPWAQTPSSHHFPRRAPQPPGVRRGKPRATPRQPSDPTTGLTAGDLTGMGSGPAPTPRTRPVPNHSARVVRRAAHLTGHERAAVLQHTFPRRTAAAMRTPSFLVHRKPVRRVGIRGLVSASPRRESCGRQKAGQQSNGYPPSLAHGARPHEIRRRASRIPIVRHVRVQPRC